MEEIKQKTGKFLKTHVIEVRHQYGIRTYACDSLEDAASAQGWGWELIKDEEEALAVYGHKSDIPGELLSLLVKGSVVVLSSYYGEEFIPSDLFDVEREAERYLARDLNRIIIIDNIEDALFFAHKYNEHYGSEVRKAARKIVREHEEYLPVQEFDVDISVSMFNTFTVRAHSREAAEIAALSLAEDEYAWSIEKDQWGEFEIEEVREIGSGSFGG